MTEESRQKRMERLFQRTKEAVDASDGDVEFAINESLRMADEFDITLSEDRVRRFVENMILAQDDSPEARIELMERHASMQQEAHMSFVASTEDEIASLKKIIFAIVQEGAKSPKHLSKLCKDIMDWTEEEEEE